ncbi:hypothetical protein BUALT_Bualt08G0087900 [Buddleja alternifolia]|uniref:SKP1-like protein n=1 Tax=Buddleja alternifolia TaxID=168488 RepID=A0AAV6X617_9LAMI|nr:hypothetical protein BUALT_Bualt08G0087900 [Buddleja alternifolia]
MSTSMAENATKKLTLKSGDDELFEVEETVALQSQTIKHMIDEQWLGDVIPLPNVTGKILSKVIEYCRRHAGAGAGSGDASTSKSEDELVLATTTSGDDLKAFDADFVKVDRCTLFDLILAAHYLNIRTLMDLTFQTAADMMKKLTVEEVRTMFNIENDFTKEEEEKIQQEHPSAFK